MITFPSFAELKAKFEQHGIAPEGKKLSLEQMDLFLVEFENEELRAFLLDCFMPNEIEPETYTFLLQTSWEELEHEYHEFLTVGTHELVMEL